MKPKEVQSILQALQLMNPSQRRSFLQRATKKQINALEEVCLNLIKNPIGLRKVDLATAKKYASTIKRLANRNLHFDKTRQILQQRGGFLGALLPILGSLVASFIAK